MKINRKELVNILNKLKLIVSNKSTNEIYKCVFFSGEKIIVKNDQICIFFPFKTDFNCYVYLDKVYVYLNSINDDEINMQLKDNKLVVTAKKSKLTIKTLENNKKIEIIFNDKKWSKIPNDLHAGIEIIFLSITNEIYNEHEYINVLHFKNNIIMSTDNKKIGKYILSNNLNCEFALSYYASNILLKIGNLKKFKLMDNQIIFENEQGYNIICLTKKCNIPDFEQFLSIPKNSIQIKFDKEICDAIILCDIFNNDLEMDNKKLFLNIKNNILNCYTETGIGKVENIFELKKSYEEILFIIHPDFLLDLIQKNKLEFFYNSELNRIYYQDNKYQFVTKTIKGSV
jgi:DNA polymerase III sliding clamp (beta) subunit (PCNA family)